MPNYEINFGNNLATFLGRICAFLSKLHKLITKHIEGCYFFLMGHSEKMWLTLTYYTVEIPSIFMLLHRTLKVRNG